MLLFILRRVTYAVVVIFLLITATFFLIRQAPGGPFSEDRELPEDVERELNRQYHFDKPMYAQYALYLRNLIRGDLGRSLIHRERTINEIIGHHLPVSAVLGGIALFLSLWIGIFAGTISALKNNSLIDYSIMAFAIVGISLPAFVFGPLIQMLFSCRLKIFPVAGYEGLRYLVLPAVTLALPFAARFSRLMRAGMLEVLSEDYIRTARAKGLSERVVVLRHALRGGIVPVVSFLGPAIPSIITGSLVVEKIFDIPGLGKEFVQSALNRDYFMVMGTVVVYGVLIVLCNLIADLIYGFLDPRVRD